MLTEEPYLGVACPKPNSIACGRVGLAVQLRRPAAAVAASIGSYTFKLHGCGEVRPCNRRTSREFTGFLTRPGLFSSILKVTPSANDMWYGDVRSSRLVDHRVRLRVEYPGGRFKYATVEAALRAGWG